MNSNVTKSLTILENVLNSKYIDKLIQQFFRENIDPEDLPYDIDNEKGIIYYFDSQLGKNCEIKFEDDLSQLLLQLTYDIINDIKQSEIKFNKTEKKRYWNLIISSLDNIEKKENNLFKKFPVCKKPKKKTLKYLQLHFNYQYDSLPEDNYFGLKEKYDLTHIESIYDFLYDNDYIETIEYDDFKSILFKNETDKKLIFKCSSTKAITIMMNLKKLFKNLDTKLIELTKRFLTKNGKPITESNYNTTKNRINNKEYKKQDHKEINDFFDINIH